MKILLTNDKLKTDTTEVSCCDGFIESSFDKTIIERSYNLPGHLTQEHDQDDVPSGDGNTGDQRHPYSLLLRRAPHVIKRFFSEEVEANMQIVVMQNRMHLSVT